MAAKKTWFQTTAIDYPNSRPHIGTAFEKLGADVQARYRRMEGYEVFFLMGNDENTVKVSKRAAELDKLVKSGNWAKRLGAIPYDLLGKTALVIGSTRGALLAALGEVWERTGQREPRLADVAHATAKACVGAKRKQEVPRAVQRLLQLDALPQADEADALACAITAAMEPGAGPGAGRSGT